MKKNGTQSKVKLTVLVKLAVLGVFFFFELI